MNEITKIKLEKMFEQKFPDIENIIRDEFGDNVFDELLDAILDSGKDFKD